MSSTASRQSRRAETEWQAEPLPRGRHKMSRVEIRASQRARLLRAMTELVNSEGYEATSVPKVVKAARVSTNTFYEFFDDKAACFIAVCEQAGTELWDRLVGFAQGPDWITALDRGLDFFLEWWVERAALTRAYLIELPAVGRRAVDERERQHRRFTMVVRALAARARTEQPELPPIGELTLQVATFVPTEIVTREVRAGRLAALPDLKPELMRLMVTLIADEATARRLPSG
jgi:AcrR family transcriptional regulator